MSTTFGDVRGAARDHRQPQGGQHALAQRPGIKLGSTGGIAVDPRMRTSDPTSSQPATAPRSRTVSRTFRCRDSPGSHAYAQGKTAGINAAGGDRVHNPVYVPWGMLAGEWMIGGVSFGETLATALGLPFVTGSPTASPGRATTRASSRSR